MEQSKDLWFQCRVLHQILGVKKLLLKMKYLTVISEGYVIKVRNQ